MTYDQWKDSTDCSDDPPGPLPLNAECPYCGAKVGYSCVSRNHTKGTWAAKTHLARWKAVGVNQPDYDDRHRDYWDYKKRARDRISAEYARRRAANAREYELEVWQNGEWCASASGTDWERVHAEAMLYAMVYERNGPIEIRGIPTDKMEQPRRRTV